MVALEANTASIEGTAHRRGDMERKAKSLYHRTQSVGFGLLVRDEASKRAMVAEPKNDPVLTRYRAALVELYGHEIDRVVLFGSRARGQALATSDYDVAIFLKSYSGLWEELDRLVGLTMHFVEHAGVMFDAKPFPKSAYDDRTPIMHEIRHDGLDI